MISWSELGTDTRDGIIDYGDVFPTSSSHDSMDLSISSILKEMIDNNQVPVILGGDHSITYVTCKSIAHRVGPMKIVHFDAHPDLYDNFEGNPSSHASPFARISEHGGNICTKLISMGIRTLNPHQIHQAHRFNVEICQARCFPLGTASLKKYFENFIDPCDSVYITFDMDCLDPAFAPGVSHREPGGISTRQAVDAIMSIPGKIIGADVVECKFAFNCKVYILHYFQFLFA